MKMNNEEGPRGDLRQASSLVARTVSMRYTSQKGATPQTITSYLQVPTVVGFDCRYDSPFQRNATERQFLDG